MFYVPFNCMKFLKIYFYLFSQEHKIGSHMQFTGNCGYDSNKIKFSYRWSSQCLRSLLRFGKIQLNSGEQISYIAKIRKNVFCW